MNGYKEVLFTSKKKFPIIVFGISLFYTIIHILYFPALEDLEYSSIFSEGLIAIILLFSIFALSIHNKKIYTLMMIGLVLIYLAMVTDTLDEMFAQPAMVSLIFEDLFLITGFIFINLGIYSWSKYSNDLNTSLKEKVQSEVEKNKEKERIIFNQSRLTSMGEMIGAIAHQWRQPLNSLAIHLQFIIDDFEDGLVDKKYLNDYSSESMKLINFMSKTIDDFRNFAKNDTKTSVINIKKSIEESQSLFETQLHNNDISFIITAQECFVNINENEFRQVLLNLLNNAKDEILEKKIQNPKIEINIKKLDDNCIIDVEDNAGGIPKEVLPRLFEPYFSTKDEGNGTGLGLYMSKKIIEESMSGEISASNAKHGAMFSIKLKLAEPV